MQKKLRDIETMKTKWSVFNEDQLQKLAKEEALRKEEEELQKKLAAKQ